MGRTVEDRKCAHCSGPIVRVPRRGPLPVFCGPECRSKAGHVKESSRRAELRIGLTCKGCGAKFDADRWRRKWCSSSCCWKHRRR